MRDELDVEAWGGARIESNTKRCFSCQRGQQRAGTEELTADLTNSAKGLSGTQYRNQKQRQTAILPMCKQGKAFHRFKVQGEVNVFKLFYQFNPDLKVWLAQTQKLQRGHPQGAVVPEKLDSRLPSGDATWKDTVAPALPLSPSVPYSWNICWLFYPLVSAVRAAIGSDVARWEGGRQTLEVCSWPPPHCSGQSPRLFSPPQRHTPLPWVLQFLHPHFPVPPRAHGAFCDEFLVQSFGVVVWGV